MLALQVLVDKPEQVKPINENKVQGKSKMTNKTNFSLTEENKSNLLKEIAEGSVIVINIKDVEGGSSELSVGTFLTGTKEEREEDINQRALSIFTNAMSRRIAMAVNTFLPNECLTDVVKADPKFVRILEPNLPEEALKVFDEAESFEAAIKVIQERNLIPEGECDCPACSAKDEAEKQQNASEKDSAIH